MNISIDRDVLLKMLRQVSKKNPDQRFRDYDVVIYALEGQCFLEANGNVAGGAAIVTASGGVKQNLERFYKLVSSYENKPVIVIEANEKETQIFSSMMSSRDYTTEVKLPAGFIKH